MRFGLTVSLLVSIGAVASSCKSDSPVASRSWTHVSAGGEHVCAIDDGGAAYCWGNDRYGQLGTGVVGAAATAPTAVDVSGFAAGTKLEKISAGPRNTCAIDAAGVVYCWGDNANGQVGTPTAERLVSTPLRIDPAALGGEHAVDVAVGYGFACAVTATGGVYCWGSNALGVLGSGGSSETPVVVPVQTAAVRVFAGTYQACALAAAGNLDCWGDLSWIGGTERSAPVGMAGGVSGAALGSNYACITGTGGAQCIGYAPEGRLGAGPGVDQASSWQAVAMPASAGDLASVTAGGSVTCGLTTAGVAYCWGDGNLGDLGDGTTGRESYTPVAVATTGLASGEKWVELSAGGWDTCGVTSAGALYCWGSDGKDELGDGGEPNSGPSPRPVSTAALGAGETVVQIATAINHACGVTSAGRVLCWGRNIDGRLGDGTIGPGSREPVVVGMPATSAGATFVQVVVGEMHSCALASDGAAYCWGSARYGQLGNGTTYAPSGQPSPGAVDRSGVSGDGKLAKLFAAFRHTCAVATDGSGYCWGYRSEVRDPWDTVATPVQIDVSALGGDARLVDIDPGITPCAVTADGRAFCWEGNGATPVDVSGVTGSKTVIHIVSDELYEPNHRCIAMADGAVYCWGLDPVLLGLGPSRTPAYGTIQPAPIDASLAAAGGFTSLSAGAAATCAVDASRAIVCWGYDDAALIDGSSEELELLTPTPIGHGTALPPFVQVSVGYWSACAVTADGRAFCWGFNAHGQLGDGGALPLAARPTLVSADR